MSPGTKHLTVAGYWTARGLANTLRSAGTIARRTAMLWIGNRLGWVFAGPRTLLCSRQLLQAAPHHGPDWPRRDSTFDAKSASHAATVTQAGQNRQEAWSVPREREWNRQGTAEGAIARSSASKTHTPPSVAGRWGVWLLDTSYLRRERYGNVPSS